MPPGRGRVRTAGCRGDEPARKVDIAHSGQTVAEALEHLSREIKNAQRSGEDGLLVVHGYGASGAGGAIKAAMRKELSRLERVFRFKAYTDAERDRVPEWIGFDRRQLSPGSTLLVFRRTTRDKEPAQGFRTNFRRLRKRVRY